MTTHRSHLAHGLDELLPSLRALYEDLHAHPELSGQEVRTAAAVAARLRDQGWQVTERVGGTGVVGVLTHGEGPVILLRADMDALPVREATGLPYAATATAVDRDGVEVPVMHACGHDMHTTCLLGATALLAANRDAWRGTVLAVFQPAEETAEGAAGMLADGFADRFPRPDVCLGQHVAPLPAGRVATRPGLIAAAADTLRVVLHGRGGHGSSPEYTVDPVVMAAAVVLRLQTVVAREVATMEAAVVTVGTLHAGTKANVIADTAELRISVRSNTPEVRTRVLAAVERVIRAEAEASGAPKEPEIDRVESFPLTVNDRDATARAMTGVTAAMGAGNVITMPWPIPGSEDFGVFGAALGVPSVFWFFGSGDTPTTAVPEQIGSVTELIPVGVPLTHAPDFAPRQDPTIETGVRALLAAADGWIGAPATSSPDRKSCRGHHAPSKEYS